MAGIVGDYVPDQSSTSVSENPRFLRCRFCNAIWRKKIAFENFSIVYMDKSTLRWKFEGLERSKRLGISQTNIVEDSFWTYGNTLSRSDADIDGVPDRYRESWTWFNFADYLRPGPDKDEVNFDIETYFPTVGDVWGCIPHVRDRSAISRVFFSSYGNQALLPPVHNVFNGKMCLV